MTGFPSHYISYIRADYPSLDLILLLPRLTLSYSMFHDDGGRVLVAESFEFKILTWLESRELVIKKYDIYRNVFFFSEEL